MERIKTIDIAKGCGIIMIVYAHTHAIYSDILISLAVPLFFIISGFLHNPNNSFLEFFKKKFVRLYLPFICCNLILPTAVLIKRYTLNLDIHNNFIYIFKIFLTLEKDGFLFGATWFLGSLFVIALLFKISENLFKQNYLIIGILTFVIVIFTGVFAEIDYSLRRTIICSIFYLFGILSKKYFEIIKNINTKYILSSAITIFIASCYYFNTKNIYTINYGKFSLENLIIFILISISFSILMYYICNLINNTDKILNYLGQNSIHILIWHFVFFEIVTAIILVINNKPLFIIEQLPHVITKNPIWLCIYFIFGMCGSILLAFIYKKIFKIFRKEKGIS